MKVNIQRHSSTLLVQKPGDMVKTRYCSNQFQLVENCTVAIQPHVTAIVVVVEKAFDIHFATLKVVLLMPRYSMDY